ncbi:uncharacterized protein Z518_07346 [Rhinocladiella mackenziei CBS 650.93]|uniref:Uncharacterized protein n=1 Tax=Rhinocladiella mackenziei CBS 650.93 TaxID=1442369 RepID=A0A0D2H024_9EURO|nr:uncharacterized protein Z518_07346 [Rhinocladiella mackenziei CBS 650.93]KIX03793.1 hypothetical protein Z518_07346 [Rhinocladiella mackenziei CBS 650.93]
MSPDISDALSDAFDGFSIGDETVEECLIIALDFGTTYSGIAYAFASDPENVRVIQSWPGEDRIVSKAPTTIRYEPGYIKGLKWGYDLDCSSGEKIERIKLLFDPEQPKPYCPCTNFEAENAKLPKHVVNVASDYMRAIFQHAIKAIGDGYMDRESLSQMKRQCVLTVPALWSDKAKNMTLQAAQTAGIAPVEMITEPEAAALFTLHSMRSKGLKAKDAIVVCDAGGGTADLISYEIVSLAPFEVKALTRPSGGLAGSSMINEQFEAEIRKVVRDSQYFKLKDTGAYRLALKDFDSVIKPGFRGKNDPVKYVSFPMADLKDNPSEGLIKNAMTLSGETLFKIFEPVVGEIDRLVKEQVNNANTKLLQDSPRKKEGVNAIFLVGGMGSSRYLKEVIQHSNPGIRVIQPEDAWAAIVRGAVMSKLPTAATVTASVATKHYGVSVLRRWNRTRDAGWPKLKDEWTDRKLCTCMDWFIYMDDQLERGKKIKHKFYRTFSGHKPTCNVLQITDCLYECTSTFAPDHPQDDVEINCRLFTDLSQVPKKFFKKKTRESDGAPYCALSYSLQIENNQSGLMKYSLEIGGKEYSAVEAEY